MKIPAVFTLNGARVDVVLEVADELLASPAKFLDDEGLRARWHCSARTTYRLRTARAIAFTQPMPGKFLYAIADVDAFEAAARVDALPIRSRVARRTA